MHPDDTCPDGAVRIPLRAKDGSIRAYAIVDAADADWANQWHWSLNNGYAHRRMRQNGHALKIYLHRALLGLHPGDGLEGDHIDRNRMNNRRSNLRAVTRAQNMHNVAGNTSATSRFRGVSWDKRLKKWIVHVSQKHIGVFADETEAAEAARSARRALLSHAVD